MMFTAVAEMVDEQSLGLEEALEQLRQFLGKMADDRHVRVSLDRLAATDDELTFREMLGRESLRLMHLDEAQAGEEN